MKTLVEPKLYKDLKRGTKSLLCDTEIKDLEFVFMEYTKLLIHIFYKGQLIKEKIISDTNFLNLFKIERIVEKWFISYHRCMKLSKI